MVTAYICAGSTLCVHWWSVSLPWLPPPFLQHHVCCYVNSSSHSILSAVRPTALRLSINLTLGHRTKSGICTLRRGKKKGCPAIEHTACGNWPRTFWQQHVLAIDLTNCGNWPHCCDNWARHLWQLPSMASPQRFVKHVLATPVSVDFRHQF